MKSSKLIPVCLPSLGPDQQVTWVESWSWPVRESFGWVRADLYYHQLAAHYQLRARSIERAVTLSYVQETGM